VPKHAHAQVKADFWAIFDDLEAAPGTVAEATRRAKTFAARWRKLYPAAVECLEDDFEHLVTYLRFPKEHWRRIRHSNFISSGPSARRAGG
jgi:putative transposase